MTDDDRKAPRPLDLVSLVAGLLSATAWLAFATDSVDNLESTGRILWSGALIVVGLVLLVRRR